MKLTVEHSGNGVAIIHAEGKLNMVSAAQLREEVAATVAAGSSRLVVDFARVDFLDSSGLGALISGLKAARQAGGDLRLANTSDQVKLVLQLTNLEKVLSTVDDASTAYANG
ncbi:STAS domain-containing protein [Galbitalea soli]|uniref:Anti-sigma factor antagonist n=1 Tax=Galbitalea soli TaxID=1268042 RepID=A0A7C9TRT2_9MICO|nr:STAS domain-containing protein [Galbitalea soli]NEM91955.1 STAS domain-containing protein [Galbitalea soli]NYJ32097.1 anti-sigma B factor antagonist [Galbitalea soli]